MLLQETVETFLETVIDVLTPVNWTAVTAFATIIAAGVAVRALMAQMRGLKQSLGSSTYQNLVQQFNEYQNLLMEHPELYWYIYKSSLSGERAVPKKARARCLRKFWCYYAGSSGIADRGLAGSYAQEVNWLLGILFNWYENAAIQTDRYAVIPQDVAQHWQNMLCHELRSPVIRNYWSTHGDHFHPLLGEWVRRALDK
ncbi:hypothetical protein MNVM_21320 [Mycobacterium novum]|uniref:DUF4760 domain-containing protein n=1 Tax=Mycobacterium novum TaxID=2492438 RepID=A0A7I7JP98_9MYCO|nr:hypothetical protein MNVM_21320 [Mycobacterium novum]